VLFVGYGVKRRPRRIIRKYVGLGEYTGEYFLLYFIVVLVIGRGDLYSFEMSKIPYFLGQSAHS
jgi:hypothetical protein